MNSRRPAAWLDSLADAYFHYLKHDDPDSEWAIGLAEHEPPADTLERWEIVRHLINRAPDPYSLSRLAAGAVEDLMREHAETLIEVVEHEALSNPRVREAIAHAWIWPEHVGSELAARFEAIADDTAVDWPRDDQGLPAVVEPLLASDSDIDRRWAVRQLACIDPTEPVRRRLRALLDDADAEVVSSAAKQLATVEDAESLPKIVSLLSVHPGDATAIDLAWAADWLIQYVDKSSADGVRAALVGLAMRGDDAVQEYVGELFDPDSAEQREAEWNQRFAELNAKAEGEFDEELWEMIGESASRRVPPGPRRPTSLT